jgi:hypothetical protein
VMRRGVVRNCAVRRRCEVVATVSVFMAVGVAGWGGVVVRCRGESRRVEARRGEARRGVCYVAVMWWKEGRKAGE